MRGRPAPRATKTDRPVRLVERHFAQGDGPILVEEFGHRQTWLEQISIHQDDGPCTKAVCLYSIHTEGPSAYIFG